MRIEARGLIYDATNVSDSDAVSYVTSLVPLRSGTFLAGWQCGPEKHAPTNTIRLARSIDGAETWELLPFPFENSWQGIPGSFMAAEMVEVQPGRLMLFTTWVNRSDPDRPLFNPTTEGILATRILFCTSTDEGDTWDAWTELATPGLSGCAITGPIVQWPDQTIACAFESFKEFDDPQPVDPAAWLIISQDKGRSFGSPWQVARHPRQEKYYWDQRLCPTQTSGEFIAMFWTHSRKQQRDAHVHLIRASINESPAAAGQPVETNIPGQIAACCVAEDGRLLTCVVNRSHPGTITLWQSCDFGSNWPEKARLVIHRHNELAEISQGQTNIDYAEFWEDMGKWSFGHPAIRPLGNDWLIAWYAGTPKRMSIHWARVVEQ